MATLTFPDGKSIQNVKHIMFDKDGTIFDIHHYWCSMIKLRAELFAAEFNREEIAPALCRAMGVDSSGQKLKPEGPVGIKSRSFITEVTSAALSTFGVTLSPAEVEKRFKEVDISSQGSIGNLLKILPGVLEFLSQCKSYSIKLTIATTDLTERAKKSLDAKGLSYFFEVICGGDSVEETKPASDMAFLVLDRVCGQKDESIMIGDHTVDILMAKNAEILAGVGVSTGLLAEEELKKFTDYVTDNLSKIVISNDEN